MTIFSDMLIIMDFDDVEIIPTIQKTDPIRVKMESMAREKESPAAAFVVPSEDLDKMKKKLRNEAHRLGVGVQIRVAHYGSKYGPALPDQEKIYFKIH